MTKRKPTIFDLMIITGMTLVIYAIPMGIFCAIIIGPAFQGDWHWRIIAGVTMTIALILLGLILFWTGETVLKRRLGKTDKSIPKA
jgi:uncharacterized membrane protein YqjE